MKDIFISEGFFLIPQLAFILVAGMLLLGFSKADLHILINQLNSPEADVFFKWVTEFGHGLSYLAVLLFLLTRKLKWMVAFVIAVALSNLILLIMKQGLFPDVYRPAKYFEIFQNYKLHLVDGVRLHSRHSFPSGHTTTAFTVFLILATLTRKNVLKLALFTLALLTGFSRVYLSQHFVVDIVVGSLLGTLSVVFGIWAVGRFQKSWLEKTPIKLKISHNK